MTDFQKTKTVLHPGNEKTQKVSQSIEKGRNFVVVFKLKKQQQHKTRQLQWS